MRKNQLLYQSDLAPEDSPQTLQSKISKGSRGYSIPLITPSAGVAGFALPGSRVDVLSSPSARRGQESQESLTVVENVQVLAVDNIAVPEDAPSNPKTMTLLLTPEQTRRVDQAQAKGPLRLSLRNSDDADVIDIPEGEVSVNAPNTSETIAASPVSLTSDSGHQPALPLNVLVFRESMASVTPVRRVKTRRPSKPLQTVQTTPRVNFPAH
jgi:Flp pilus assembly protein CpaB